ncbi:L-cysteine desulfidase family protein [Desulfopila inferna]|uniref:L-cysteine desulfidase family protein n=1 Tax=Desulfopila inferna TaxID=468528 RepID=UPI0019645B60|nr:L-serine ammonia-lyase, iron-sulfur-dependent, subunit alpha [Desulfopila inferna]MBM9606384.1 serine dehydratase subunit alpha family protein [Desulfopila inferna]
MSFSAKDILQMQVAPALGCTEPVAVALGAAAAASLLPDRTIDSIDSIEILLDPNIYKNGLAVIIPGTHGMIGLDTASILGALGGDPALGLEVLADIDDDTVAGAKTFLEHKGVTVNLREESGLYVHTTIKSAEVIAESVIVRRHNNIVELRLNGIIQKGSPLLKELNDGTTVSRHQQLEDWLKQRRLEDLVALIEGLDAEDLQFIEEGIQCNLKLAAYGLKYGTGLGIGKALERMLKQKLLTRDMSMTAKILTSAAADARMGGARLPAMSSAGSGNHGLTATLPIWAIKDFIDHDHETVLRAVGLSHIVTAYVKAHIGTLSAVCGCSVAAGAGAAAGITYLIGGDAGHMAGAIKNISEDLTGIICDGAKAGCAIKLNTAAGAAVQAALFSLQGISVQDTDGIIGDGPESTVRNMGIISTEGMVATDKTIIKIMREKQQLKAGKS